MTSSSRFQVFSDAQWARVAPLLPSNAGRRGHPFGDDRRVVEAIAYRYRTGIAWRDLPREQFGPWQTVWKRHRRHAEDGTWDRVLSRLLAEADAAGQVDWTVELPEARAQSRSIGRLILWSNDLIVDHVGPGFAHMQHVSSFLWWAKDVVPQSSEAGNGRAVNHTGKYRELWRWLRDQRGDEVQTTFSAVEAVLGIPLPPSAREYVAHWHGYEGSALARAIKDAGWRSSHVDLALGTVVFAREHD